MEDPEIRFHSGIPVGHKFLAFLLAAAVAGAGCAWLIWKSTRSASAAVLAFNLTLAQHLDSGIASAPHPAIALANLMLNDQTVARLAKQARVASSTPAGQIGEFRSSLQFAETPAQQLEVRFQSGDGSQSIAVANDVAHVLAAWTPAAAAATTPPPPAQAATPPTPQPAPVAQGQSHPAAAGSPASQAAPPPPPLSAALRKLGAHLTAMGQQVDRLSAGGAALYGGEQAAYTESRQQSLLKSGVREAQRTLAGLHHPYAKELADPVVRGRMDEIHQALDSILPGGVAAVGVSRSELRSERSELSQAVWILNRETDGIQLEEAAHPALSAQPAAPPAEAAAAQPAEAPAQPAPAAAQPASTSSPAAAASSQSPVQEQNIPPATQAAQAPQPAVESPWSIVHLAVPASRPRLWPAITAGILCGLLYLGIAAFAYRRGANDDIYPELRSAAPQRMITPDDPVSLDEASAAEPESPRVEPASRHRAAFVFQQAPPEDATARVEGTATPAEERLPLR